VEWVSECRCFRVSGEAEMRETAQLFRVREPHTVLAPHLGGQGDLGPAARGLPAGVVAARATSGPLVDIARLQMASIWI